MSSDVAIKVENLSKCYHIYDKPRDRLLQMLAGPRKQYFREFWALKDVSFTVEKGESVGIIGRNGSGKSTLLQLICGTLNPTSGHINTKGRIAALLELGSGFNPEFSGLENVFMNAAVLGLNTQETKDRLGDILAFADIGEFIDQPVKLYSSGMALRLAFAVQAMVDPEILVVDEALAVGDEKFQRKCFSRIEDLKSRGTSILFVSHSGPQIIELCDRALLLEKGEKILHTTPADVVRSYQKLIYAPESEQREIVSSLKLADLTQTHVPQSIGDKLKDIQHSLFDPNLTPTTTTIYPEQGARIERIEIQDEAGKPINVLQTTKKFRIVVTGVFLSKATNVHFGIHVRSISGAVITGQRYPEEGHFISTSENGEKFRIEYWFSQNFLPGAYFAGGGIWSEDGATCAHRILDAIMFRVEYLAPLNSFGYCDMMAAPVEFHKG